MIITTTQNVEGKSIEKYVGIVAVQSDTPNIHKDLPSLTSFIAQAVNQDANAIIGVTVSPINQGSITGPRYQYLVIGTAVIVSN